MMKYPANLRSLPVIPFALESQQNSSLKLKYTIGGHLVFQNDAQNISRQAFVMMNISYKFENSTFNILASGGIMGKSLHAAVAEA